MIYCCGEALIDMLPESTTIGQIRYAAHTGGSVYNTAIALARLDSPVGLFSGLSSDVFGDMLRRELHNNGVNYAKAITSDRFSTLSFVNYIGDQARYSFYDQGSAGRMIDISNIPDFKESVQAFFFGGISLVFEPACDAYVHLLQSKAANHFTMVDPNIRPGFITDVEKYRQRIDRVFSLVSAVKVSDEDLEWIYPDYSSTQERINELLAKGPEIVFLTRGANGAEAHLQNGCQCISPGQAVDVVDTIGAGDTFNAAILAQLAEQNRLDREILRSTSAREISNILNFAVRAAAISVTRAGANPPRRAEVLSHQVS